MKQVTYLVLAAFLVLLGCQATTDYTTAQTIPTEHGEIYLQELLTGLEHPWALQFINEEELLITERPGRIQHHNLLTNTTTQVTGLPDITARGQGGLLDLALHPSFHENNQLYITYTTQVNDQTATALAQATYNNYELTNLEELFVGGLGSTSRHYGSRIALDENYLYFSIGDRGERARAQNLSDAAGSIIRLYHNGTTPPNNPFVDVPQANHAIYAYGVRNPQGLLIHPETGALWEQEHGPRGGDEVNVIQAGNNYGWPNFTRGSEYYGPSIGVDEPPAGVTGPLHDWTPSIAPSGMTYYTGEELPAWRGNIFVGALAGELLTRLEFEEETLIHEEQLLQGTIGRIRDVRTGPDGYIYLLTDASNAQLYRLGPFV